MKIKYHKNFEKRFKKLSSSLKEKTILAIEKFTKNPFNSALKTHKLTGKLEGKWAFSVTGDVRVVFEKHGNYILVIMLDVGTHAQVYKN